MALDAPHYISNSKLHEELRIPTLDTTIQKNTINTVHKMQTHHYPLIKPILTAKNKTIKKEGINKLKRKAEENPEVIMLINKKDEIIITTINNSNK